MGEGEPYPPRPQVWEGGGAELACPFPSHCDAGTRSLGVGISREPAVLPHAPQLQGISPLLLRQDALPESALSASEAPWESALLHAGGSELSVHREAPYTKLRAPAGRRAGLSLQFAVKSRDV